MRVTIAQVAATADVVANVAILRDAVREATRLSADLLVLPEYASAYDRQGVGIDMADDLSGRYVSEMRELARSANVTIIAGVTLRPHPSDLAAAQSAPAQSATDSAATDVRARAINALVAVNGSGQIVGVYHKVHLYDAFHSRESDRLLPGPADAPAAVIEVAGLRVGMMTCYDLRFPEVARRLADAGASVFVVPAAWQDGPAKLQQWQILAQARAIENVGVVVAVGMPGKGLVGHSLIAGPDGTMAPALGGEPAFATADIDPEYLVKSRLENPSLDNRRYAVVPRS